MRALFSRHRIRCAALVVAFVALVLVGRATLPSVGHGSASVDGRAVVAGDLPIFVAGKGLRRLEAVFSIDVPWFRPRRVIVVPDDCVEYVVINGIDVQPSLAPCSYGNHVVDVAPAVRRGANSARVVVHNQHGRTALDVSVRSGIEFAGFALALLTVAACLAFVIATRRRGRRPQGVVLGLVFAGAVLRTLYLLTTPATVRAHDADKHLDYIRYIATYWHLPPPHEGFEFYQPPLYYSLTAPLLAVERRAGAALSDTVFHLQLVALVLSVIALWIALRTLRSLLATRSGAPRTDLAFGGAVLAVFPALVYFSARINNDVLVQVTSFAGVALVVTFWKSGRTATWMAFALCVAAGMLTKSNTYVVLGLGLACLAARRGTSLRRKALLGAWLAVIVSGIAGWFVVRRFLQERGTQGLLVSNVGWLSREVHLSNTLDALLGFHPLQVFEHPYNSPSNLLTGRQFWQYFFRSSLFGEFDFGPQMSHLSRILLELLVLLGLVALRGWWVSLRHRLREDFPVHALFIGSLASQFAFRVVSPYVPSQDFRYSFLIVLPFAYFVALGIRHMPPWPRRAAVVVWGAFVACSASFLLTLWVVVVP